jgi:hypothetical protein
MELTAQVGIAIGPPAVGALFAYSVSNNWLGGRAVWVVLVVAAMGIPACAWCWTDMPSWIDERDKGDYEQLFDASDEAMGLRD